MTIGFSANKLAQLCEIVVRVLEEMEAFWLESELDIPFLEQVIVCGHHDTAHTWHLFLDN